MNAKRIELGWKVRDTITGFAGIAVARTEWLYGCTRIVIEPMELREGKPIDSFAFDEQRVEVLEELRKYVSPHSAATTGGPMPDPKPARAPR